MSIIEKVFHYEENEITVIKCRNDIWFRGKDIANQVIPNQVITGEQGKKYCETLPAPFERHDSEFSGDMPIENTNIESLNLPCHNGLHIVKA